MPSGQLTDFSFTVPEFPIFFGSPSALPLSIVVPPHPATADTDSTAIGMVSRRRMGTLFRYGGSPRLGSRSVLLFSSRGPVPPSPGLSSRRRHYQRRHPAGFQHHRRPAGAGRQPL